MEFNISRRSIVSSITFASISLATGLALGQIGQRTKISPNQDALVVHEWGTFTELQNERGEPLRGINTDDEPVPDFVHGFGDQIVGSTFTNGFRRAKFVPYAHPQVTMRLETPVIYFYPPKDRPLPMKLDVRVDLQGGWLSEYYPDANCHAEDPCGNLDPKSIASLSWNNLQIGTNARFPDTSDPVWLNPRATQAAAVTAENGESEKYLFYRGVGNFGGPVSISLSRKCGQLRVKSGKSGEPFQTINHAWLVQNDGGKISFRSYSDLSLNADFREIGEYRFNESADGDCQLDELKTEMHKALMKDGLFADEATAMLNTWNEAYFKSAGLRFFYVVPKQWTDDRMPLSISEDAIVERVMMGRIELISDEQRSLINKLRQTTPSAAWIKDIPKSPARENFLNGMPHFGDLGVEPPQDFLSYQALGRFRNAMIFAEQEARPCENLELFIKQYRLLGYWRSKKATGN